MARLRTGILEEKMEEDSNRGFSDLEKATYSIYNRSGVDIFHLRTYGTRDSLNKQPSQNIEIDKDMAKELIKLLVDFI